MKRIRSRRVFATEIRLMQVVMQLTDGQRREIYLSSIIIGPAIAVLVEPTATALLPVCSQWTAASWPLLQRGPAKLEPESHHAEYGGQGRPPNEGYVAFSGSSLVNVFSGRPLGFSC